MNLNNSINLNSNINLNSSMCQYNGSQGLLYI